jgi:hypothetical protein
MSPPTKPIAKPKMLFIKKKYQNSLLLALPLNLA